MKIVIETNQLILREIQESDCEGLFALDSNPTVHKYLGGKPITTKNQAKKIIQFIQKQYKERGVGRLATIEKATGKFIGWVGLKLNKGKEEELNGHRNFYDIGYRLRPEFWGKGYATEASIAILEHGFRTLKISKIIGVAEVENIASNVILKKIGLQLIDEFIYDNKACNWYELTHQEYNKL